MALKKACSSLLSEVAAEEKHLTTETTNSLGAKGLIVSGDKIWRKRGFFLL